MSPTNTVYSYWGVETQEVFEPQSQDLQSSRQSPAGDTRLLARISRCPIRGLCSRDCVTRFRDRAS